MSCLEKQHVSRKASMKHPSNLDSFMDETDREVMSLTDRAFKSLCVGDEAIYNDSEFLSSPPDCHKPLACEKTSKKRSGSDVKRHGSHQPNGVYNIPWQINKNTSKMSSLFAAIVAKKKNDTKMTNGDSWDKSALLSVQTERAQFSPDYQKHIYQDKSHCKPAESKGTVNKSTPDIQNSSGKASKNKHSKSSKLRKLNSKNFFLHSEFSPFESWGDLNRLGLENIEMFACDSPAGLFDSSLYRQLNNSNTLHVPQPNKRETSQSTSPLQPRRSRPDLSPCTAQTLKTGPPVPQKHSQLNSLQVSINQIETVQPQVLMSSTGSIQRCQSEGDLYAPWRKSRTRVTGVDVQPLISSPSGTRSKTGEQGSIQNKNEVGAIEHATNSTPFSISHLLTPVIPSRQGTGTSEVLQSLPSPSALEIPALYETDNRPSPDIKREGYKSKASGLLFNLKDNRKRVKATYSPPKFKGLDVADQNKLSPLIEKDATNNVLENPEITETTTTVAVQKPNTYPMSPESANIPSSQSSSHINSMMPDDFLGLSLLHSGNRGSPSTSFKTKNNPLAKPTYPSLNLYRKSSPVEVNDKPPESVEVRGTTVNKSAQQKVSREDELAEKDKDVQRKYHSTKPDINNANNEYIPLNRAETVDKVLTPAHPVTQNEKHLIDSKIHNVQQDAPKRTASRNPDKLNMGGVVTAEQSDIISTESQRKETNDKHLFSARQNNYIKIQRYASEVDNECDVECEYWKENVISAVRDEPRTRDLNINMHKDQVQEVMDDVLMKESVTNDAFSNNHYGTPSKNDLGTCTEKAKNDASSMKGNTSAKIALFTLKEEPSNAVSGSKKKNLVKCKYELATVALEKMIAEREQRQKQSDRQSGPELPMEGEHIQESTLASSTKSGSGVAERRGQKAICDFTPTNQNVGGMTDIDTNHGDCHAPGVKLVEPNKQEGAAKHSPSRPIYTDRSDRHGQESDTSNIMSMLNVSELKGTVWKPNNVWHEQGSSVDQDYEKQTHKPEDSPRRVRANAQSEDRTMNERQRKEEKLSVDNKVKHGECLSMEVKTSNLPNDEGPVIDHVSSHMSNRQPVVPSINVQECLSKEDGHVVYHGNDLLKQKVISREDTRALPEVEATKHNHKAREADSDSKEKLDKNTMISTGNEESAGGELTDEHGFQTVRDVTKNEHVTKKDKKSYVVRNTDNQTNSRGLVESFAKESLTEHSGKSEEPGNEIETIPTSNLSDPDNAPIDRVVLYDILNQPVPSSSSVDVKQTEQGKRRSQLSQDSSVLEKTEESLCPNKSEERKDENFNTVDSFFTGNPESKPQNSDALVLPTKDLDKRGWVHCLIDSAHNLTPTCQSNASSPTLGKPALFKVKDNTFSASPVTKTVRPILHKTVTGVTQPWSPRESLSGSEKDEEDPDHFKDIVDVQSPVLASPPVQFTPLNQSSVQVAPPPSSQSTTELEKPGLTDSSAVPEEEATESYETCVGDTLEELALNTAPTASIERAKAPSERSESVCSGIENQLQGKPPAVPPKTEKALRRAMKLTTKRIQKAEAKSKSERGRSSEKGCCQKRERRHQSSDKVLSDRSYQRQHSIDRTTSSQSAGDNSSETSLPRSHTSERRASQHNNPNSRSKESEKDTGSKLYGCQTSLFSMDGEQKETQSQHKGQFDTQNGAVDSERLGRTSKKCLPHKLYRRAVSLDRVSSSRPEHRLLSPDDPASTANAEALMTLTTAHTAPVQQNSYEHTYSSPANTIVQQSFPMTQRKLLQDLDSGQYFVVDMPVQVKTKTFFDPETGRYVQLPVQSLEGSVPRAQSVEVVNAPPLMLYHGFVPMPVSSLP